MVQTIILRSTDADGTEGRSISVLLFSNEGREPPHIHVKAGGDEAKFWLAPIALAANYGFNARELLEIERLVTQHHAALRDAWDEHFA